jgi:hypothetical protein
VHAAAERLRRAGQRGDQIEDLGARFVEKAGFNPRGSFVTVGHADP